VPRREKAQAFEVDAALRLISGGTAGAATTKVLVQLDATHYQYGELEIILHESTYARCESRVVPYRSPKYPATELVLRDAAGLANSENKELSYPLNTDLNLIVEVRPVSVTRNATVAKLSAGGLVGLRVASGGKIIADWFNPTTQPQDCPLPQDFPSGTPISNRVVSSSGQPDTPQAGLPSQLTLAPHQQAVFVSSPDPVDHQPGWTSFQEMVQGGSDRR